VIRLLCPRSLLALALLLGAARPATGEEVVVGAQTGIDAATLHATLAEAGFLCSRDLLHGRVHVVALAEGERVDEACGALAPLAGVRYCEANGTVRSQAVPNDPLFDQQGYLQQIHAPTAWETTQGATSVVVAILDSGVDLDHPDLAANLPSAGFNQTDCPRESPGTCLTGDLDCLQCAPAQDDDTAQSHGTHIAGLIGAVGNNGVGIAGVNWQVALLPVKVLSQGSGTVTDVAEGMFAAVDGGARVINASFGAAGQGEGTLCDAVAYAEKNNVVVVAAAGNLESGGQGRDIDAAPEYPASCAGANLLAVTAYDGGAFDPSRFNWGATGVDLAAPGTALLSTGDLSSVGAYHLLSGTSQSTALVSGAAALLLAHEPTLTAAMVRARLLAAVDVIPALRGRCATSGRLNLAKLFPGGPADSDGDGVADTSDNCPSEVNPDQADCDGDGVGNACDATPGCTADGGGGGGGCQATPPAAAAAAWPAALLLLLPLVVAGGRRGGR